MQVHRYRDQISGCQRCVGVVERSQKVKKRKKEKRKLKLKEVKLHVQFLTSEEVAKL